MTELVNCPAANMPQVDGAKLDTCRYDGMADVADFIIDSQLTTHDGLSIKDGNTLYECGLKRRKSQWKRRAKLD